MANLQGLDLVLELRPAAGGTLKFVVCETSSSLNTERATNTTSTKCDGGVAQVGLGAFSWSVDYSGAVKIDPEAPSQLSYKDILVWAKDGTSLFMRRTKSGVIQQEGECYITSTSDSAEVDGLVTFDFTLQGNGELQIYGDGQS